MANPTYILIASQTLASSASSVTFSSIPQTYTDLKLMVSARSNYAAVTDVFYGQINSNSSLIYSGTSLYGNGSSAGSTRTSGTNFLDVNGFPNAMIINGANSTSNIFSNKEFYFPNYTSSQNKPASSLGATENNATAGYVEIDAFLARDTNPITSIAFGFGNGSLIAGSSFYLYGIKNS